MFSEDLRPVCFWEDIAGRIGAAHEFDGGVDAPDRTAKRSAKHQRLFLSIGTGSSIIQKVDAKHDGNDELFPRLEADLAKSPGRQAKDSTVQCHVEA